MGFFFLNVQLLNWTVSGTRAVACLEHCSSPRASHSAEGTINTGQMHVFKQGRTLKWTCLGAAWKTSVLLGPLKS